MNMDYKEISFEDIAMVYEVIEKTEQGGVWICDFGIFVIDHRQKTFKRKKAIKDVFTQKEKMDYPKLKKVLTHIKWNLKIDSNGTKN